MRKEKHGSVRKHPSPEKHARVKDTPMFPRKTVHEALVYGQVRHAHAAHHMRLATERHGLALVVEIAREVPWTDGAPSP